jgi:hypothetical protein
VIRAYDEAGNVIETHEHKGRFQRVLIAIYVRRSASDIAGPKSGAAQPFWF